MRILVVIPHYFAASDEKSVNRSLRPSARQDRKVCLMRTLQTLQFTFGGERFSLNHMKAMAKRARKGHQLDILVATAGAAHLLDELPPVYRALFRHVQTPSQPQYLGFAAHAILADHAGKYDYYCYVEDDIGITDSCFFSKRRLFDAQFGPEALLQPQRFEVGGRTGLRKLYVDYAMRPGRTEPYQDIADRPRLRFDYAGDEITVQRSTYPSAGSFFLNAQQLEIWRKSANFLDGDVSYLSPLDSAATLSVMKTFRIYKPSLDSAWFFEVEHLSPRWISLMDGGKQL